MGGGHYSLIFSAVADDNAITQDGPQTIHRDPNNFELFSTMLTAVRETAIMNSWRVRSLTGQYCVATFMAWIGDYSPENILEGNMPNLTSGCRRCHSL